MHDHDSAARAPRVLVVLPDQWPRALLRAALREVGYDAIGTRSPAGAALQRPAAGRGPLGLVIVDAGALGGEDATRALGEARRGGAAIALLAPAGQPPPPGPWDRILRRPASIGELVRAVEEMLPLSPEARKPLD